MNWANIKYYDIADGEGVRTSLFVSGCTHHCKGCFNAETWDFNFGQLYTKETEDKIVESLRPDYIAGITLLGGEPFEPSNQKELVSLLERIRAELPQKTVWCYTGYTLETDLLAPSRARCEYTDRMLSMIDILVDGEFKEDLKDITLLFRGSSNQRLIDLKKTLEKGEVVIYKK